MCFDGGSKTQQTSSETSYAPWISDAQKAALGIAFAQNFPQMQRSSEYSHAGFNMDQQKAFDLARDAVGQYSSGGRTMVPSSAYSQGVTASSMSPASSQAATSEAALADRVQLGGNEFQEFFSPYKSTVIDSTLDRMRRERDNNNASVSAQAAARGAFGGSGEALGIAQNNRNFLSDAGQLSAQMMDQGFNAAQQLADKNTDRRQQTELYNTGNEQQTNLANAANEQQTNLANAANQQQASMQNGMWGMEAQRANIDNLYRLLGLEDQFKNTDLSRQMTVLNQLLNTGNQQQQDMQDYLDEPYEALARLFQFIPGVYDVSQVGTQPDNSPDLLSQILGVGGKLITGGLGAPAV